MVWREISLEVVLHTKRLFKTDGNIDEVLLDFIVPYADYVEDDFLLMHNNARLHTARITQQFLNNINSPVMNWPAVSTDANPNEHIWNILGEEYSHVPASLTINHLRQALLKEMGTYFSRGHLSINCRNAKENSSNNWGRW